MSNEPDGDAGRRSIWMRGLLMLLFAVFYGIAKILVVVVAVFQFFCVLITGECNARVLDLGRAVSLYMYQVLRFQVFETERLPFPFDAWPRSDGGGA